MWGLCAVLALLLTRAPPAAGGAPCDGDPSDIQLDLPDEDVYTCAENYISLPSQVLPSITSVYKQEISSHVCMDTAIVYTAAIPNSGAHRHTWAKYGEYIYCPPQQWVHNLQHGGVAFLFHPCVHPKLKKALSSLARRCIAKHIITPLHTLSKDRPLAVAAWCSTLEMSHINRTEIIGWLRNNVYIKQQYEAGEEGSYQHLLIRPSVMPSGDSSMHVRVVNYVSKRGSRLRRHTVKKRWRRFILPVTPVIQGTAIYNVSHSTTSITPAGPQTGKINNQTSVLGISVSANISTAPNLITPGNSVYLPQEAETEVVKADIHSRELDGNDKVEMPEMPANNSSPTPENITPGLSGLNLGHSVGENSSNDRSPHGGDKEELTKAAGTQPVDSESKQSKGSVNTSLFTTPPQQPQSKSDEREISPSEKLLTDRKEKKPECRCQEQPTLQLPAKPQRRLGASQQKPSGVYIATPRTEEAKWAAASLILLFALLTFSVLYTQIYKKFRKSQSLYWTSGSHSEEKESVASIIKRRLVQGHSIRKKWIGRKKSPAVLYESLSEDSE